jgi:hypothetical protein
MTIFFDFLNNILFGIAFAIGFMSVILLVAFVLFKYNDSVEEKKSSEFLFAEFLESAEAYKQNLIENEDYNELNFFENFVKDLEIKGTKDFKEIEHYYKVIIEKKFIVNEEDSSLEEIFKSYIVKK